MMDQQKPMPILRSPDDEAEVEEKRKKHSPVILLVVFGLIVLMMIAAVIWVLPLKKATMTELTNTESSLLQPQYEPFQNEKQEKEAQELLERWLKLQVLAKADNIDDWGQNDYDLIRKIVAAADDAMQRRVFEDAKKEYERAIEELEKLLSQKNTILETAIETGNRALMHNESMVAAAAFQRALAIDPDNSEARKGARRAAVRDQVVTLFAEVLEREREDELSSAFMLLSDLLTLDKDYTPGLEAKERITALVENARFHETMTLLLKSLENNDLETARKAYDEAKYLRGNAAVVRDAGRRLAEAEEATALQNLRKKAEQQCNEERWGDALATYTAALSIAPQAIFAVNGRRKAAKRADLDTVLESILSHPARLQEGGPLQEAEQTLTYAKGIPDPGPRLQSQITRLSQLLDYATTPVTINLISDNETDIVIYRVGRIGRFLHKSLTLRPGSYTIVGSRPGYRDVRTTVRVSPKKGAVQVSIMCKEPI